MNLAQSGKIEFSYALKTGSFTTELATIKFKVLAEIPATIKINEATVLSPKYSADAQDYSYTASSLKVDIGTASNPSTGTPAPTPDVQYADIQDHWAKDYILTLIDKGVISGYEDGTVRPDNLINRQEATKIIVSAIGKAAGDGANLSFTDADAIDAWAKGWVQTAVDEKIMNGYDDGSFRPAQSVSRAELAVIAMRAFGFGEDSAALTFTDKDAIPDWAKGFIAKASSMSIINGYEDGSFQPENFVTRAEACAIIAKCLEK